MAAHTLPSRPVDDGASLRIHILGPFLVSAGGKTARIPSTKGRALLGYLASRAGQDVPRAHVAELLWGERAEEQARASLRQTLSELRAALDEIGSAPLLAGKDMVSLADGVWVDAAMVERLGAATGIDQLAEAAGLVRGELLEGLATKEPAFEQWLAAERQRLRALACAVLERLAELREKAGQIEDAMADAQRVLGLDPLRESIHRSVMRLHAAQGRTEAALAQYERCRRVLFDELRVRPEAETEELARSIQTRRRAAPQRAADVEAPPKRSGDASIAVLAFDNLSGDRRHDVLGEALAEDIIGALSSIGDLFVVSRRSSFAYREASMGAAEIARELAVRYLLIGSIRIAGEQIRVMTALTDADTGAQVWSERYDGHLTDLFAMQDEITRRVVLALQIKLTQGETIRFWEGQTRNLQAWRKMVEAREYWGRYNKADNAIARRLLIEAIAIDPDYTGAIALLGMGHWWDARFNPDIDREVSLRGAEAQIAKLGKLDPDLGAGAMLRGGVALLRDRHEEAVSLCDRAVALSPSDFHTVGFLGVMCLYAGHYDRAIATLKAAMRLNPHFKPWVIYNLSVASLAAGQADTALAQARDYLERDPADRYAYTNRAIALFANGRGSEAPACIAEMRDRLGDMTIAEFEASHRFRDKAWLEQLVGWLRQAGLR